jgi:hypothetical protein
MQKRGVFLQRLIADQPLLGCLHALLYRKEFCLRRHGEVVLQALHGMARSKFSCGGAAGDARYQLIFTCKLPLQRMISCCSFLKKKSLGSNSDVGCETLRKGGVKSSPCEVWRLIFQQQHRNRICKSNPQLALASPNHVFKECYLQTFPRATTASPRDNTTAKLRQQDLGSF